MINHNEIEYEKDCVCVCVYKGFQVVLENFLPMQETQVQSLGWEDPLEEGVATHTSILAWRCLLGYSP